MMNIKKVLAFITFFTVLLMLSGAVSAANLTVNPGDSIQSVIDNASDNDTIIVNDNNGSVYMYTENIVINKSISLQAKTGGNVIIKASNSSRSVFTVTSLGNGTNIQGFIITGATDSSGIYLNSANSCNITGNIITNVKSGIYLSKNSNNNIQNNSLTGSLYSICVYNVLGGLISGNIVINSTNYGIYLSNSTNINLLNNSVIGNLTGYQYGIYLDINSRTIIF
jgi:parallel beta-helix repeat protein